MSKLKIMYTTDKSLWNRKAGEDWLDGQIAFHKGEPKPIEGYESPYFIIGWEEAHAEANSLSN